MLIASFYEHFHANIPVAEDGGMNYYSQFYLTLPKEMNFSKWACNKTTLFANLASTELNNSY